MVSLKSEWLYMFCLEIKLKAFKSVLCCGLLLFSFLKKMRNKQTITYVIHAEVDFGVK